MFYLYAWFHAQAINLINKIKNYPRKIEQVKKVLIAAVRIKLKRAKKKALRIKNRKVKKVVWILKTVRTFLQLFM